MNPSIRQRIYWSFSVLVFLFVVNAIITISTLNSNKDLSNHLSKVVDPSLQTLDEFKKILLESKMYTTNWVFLRSKQEDKELLKKLHSKDYPALKKRLEGYALQWKDRQSKDVLQELYLGFENLLVIEKQIMASLQKFQDYDDPMIKLEAERQIEEEVLPRTSALIESLNRIIAGGQDIRTSENSRLWNSSIRLQVFIFIVVSTSILLAILLSFYLTKVIISPIKQIRDLINDLGKGITRKIADTKTGDEINYMVHSVNHLSETLEQRAAFAHQMGLRNFNMQFQPLSEEDTLGKALIAMRDRLKSSDERLNEAQHIAKLGSWEWDIKSGQIFWSDELFSIFEKEKTFVPTYEEFLGFIHPEDREYANNVVMKSFQDHEPFVYECRILAKNNTMKVIYAQGKVFLNNKGEVVKMYGVAQDITERREDEQEIKEFNERFQLLSKATNDAMWDWDLVTDHVWWNANFFKMFGYDPQKGIPPLSEWTLRIHPDDKESVTKRLLGIRENPADSWEEEFRYKISNDVYGTIFDRAYVLRNENGEPVRIIGALQDITERKKTEQQIADKNKELEQKNKELEQFAYVASHDLQEPLRTISSFADRFQQQYKGQIDSNADKFLHFIIQASDRMKVLIKDLLDYSRIGKKKNLQYIDCNNIISEVLADLDSAIEETGADIKSSELPGIKGYSTEIKQLFQNLIINAIKFRKKDIAPEISISASKKKNRWEFTIKDNGIGIEHQHSERIFIIFQRLHNRSEYDGSGIGLSHCKKIVELHGGKIWVNSSPGEGSTFHFTILENISNEKEAELRFAN